MATEHHSKRAVPVAVQFNMPPQEAEAVRLYTDPLSPTYGKKKLSSDRAGADYSMWGNERVARALDRIEQEREEAGKHVAAYLSSNSASAAIELVQQLSAGRDLEVEDPRSVVDDIVHRVGVAVHEAVVGVDGLDEDTVAEIIEGAIGRGMKEQRMLLGELNTANKVALMAVKERRQALELILAYHLGTPKQHVDLRKVEEEAGESSLDLGALSDEELQSLIDAASMVKGDRNHGDSGPLQGVPVEE